MLLAWLFSAQIALIHLVLDPAWHPRTLVILASSVVVLRVVASTQRPWIRGIACGLVAFFVCLELATYRYFHVPLDVQVAIAARHSWIDVRPIVIDAVPLAVIVTAILGALEWRLVRKPIALERRKIWLAASIGALAFVLPYRNLQTLAFGRSASTVSRSVLPPLTATRRVPNVLVLLTESVRASDFREDTAPELHALFHDAVRLSQMRAVASYTALSLSALLTGLPQTGSRDAVLVAPDLFDYAQAIGAAHYWSAHSETVFERADVGRSLASFVTADAMLGHPIGDVEEAVAGGLDRRLAQECTTRLPGLAGPYLVMAHFSGTHAPYFFDEAAAKFTPFSHAATWSGLDALHHAYENAIVEQDRSIAACARAFIDAQQDHPWIVVFTSDHGEAFGEHAAIHHGQNLYDEQVHVPAIVAQGNGALTEDELAALRANADGFATHLDLVPTLLDALGIREHFAIARNVGKMPGRSLLRKEPASQLPVTNCSDMFPCPLSAWGVLAGDRKLFAQPWDRGWKCLRLSPSEHEVPIGDCSDLVGLSQRNFATLPNGDPNR